MMNWSAPGPKLFFPNIVFTLIRSGIKRPDNTFTFRVPKHLTKMDIKAYLEGLYNVSVESVETTTFLGKLSRQGSKRLPSKKNAVVRLAAESVAGFKWPDAPKPEDLKYPIDSTPNYPTVHKK